MPNIRQEVAAVKLQNIVEAVEQVMETGELNPNYYPAQRAAKVVQHYINTRYGSPFQVFILQKVHSANAEVMGITCIF